MKKKVNIKDIANVTGFSIATVSKVLRNDPYVKDSTRKKILEVIKTTGFVPDEVARSLVMKKTTNFIGLIISDISNPFFSELTLGVEAEAKKRNCGVIVCNTHYDEKEERKYIDILIRNRSLGILLATPTINDPNISFLKNIHYPFVLITRKVENIDTNLISVDHFKSAKMAVNYLIQNGHKEIAHFTSPIKVYGFIKRLEGYKSALNANNIKIDEKLIIMNESSLKGGYESAETLFRKNKRPTAIFASDDLIAIGAMEYFKKMSYKVPEDISIIGYDNIAISGIYLINLTTVNQPKYEMGEISVKILLEQIETTTNFKPIKCILKSHIVERGSVLKRYDL